MKYLRIKCSKYNGINKQNSRHSTKFLLWFILHDEALLFGTPSSFDIHISNRQPSVYIYSHFLEKNRNWISYWKSFLVPIATTYSKTTYLPIVIEVVYTAYSMEVIYVCYYYTAVSNFILMDGSLVLTSFYIFLIQAGVLDMYMVYGSLGM